MAILNFSTNLITDPSWRIALGLTGGLYGLEVLGSNDDISTTQEDLWKFGGSETILANAAGMFLSSTSASDTAVQVSITGLDNNWDLKTTTAVTGGQSQVALGAWTRIFDVITVSSTAPVGDLYVARSDTLTAGVPDTASKVHAFVSVTATGAPKRAMKALYTIPRNHFGIVTNFSGNTQGGASTITAEVRLFMQNLVEGATASSPSWAPEHMEYEVGIRNGGSSQFDRRFSVPIVVPELTNISLKGIASASVRLNGGFGLIVVPTNAYQASL